MFGFLLIFKAFHSLVGGILAWILMCCPWGLLHCWASPHLLAALALRLRSSVKGAGRWTRLWSLLCAPPGLCWWQWWRGIPCLWWAYSSSVSRACVRQEWVQEAFAGVWCFCCWKSVVFTLPSHLYQKVFQIEQWLVFKGLSLLCSWTWLLLDYKLNRMGRRLNSYRCWALREAQGLFCLETDFIFLRTSW